MTEAKQFAEAHGIHASLPASCTRRVPRQPDENAVDDPIIDQNERFRIGVLNVCLDTVIAQLTDRFAADKMPIIAQMQHLAQQKLMTEEFVSPDSIKELCEFYGLDPVLISRELEEFRGAYRSVHSFVDVADLKGVKSQLDHCTGSSYPTVTTAPPNGEIQNNTEDIDCCTSQIDDNDAADDEENVDEKVSASEFEHWTDYSYVKPLRVIYQLSAYPMLTTMYTILTSIAVTSCSAERTLSRVRVIKNRLRSTMQDDWFSALTLLACERDIFESLRVDEIVDNFAGLTAALRRHLL